MERPGDRRDNMIARGDIHGHEHIPRELALPSRADRELLMNAKEDSRRAE